MTKTLTFILLILIIVACDNETSEFSTLNRQQRDSVNALLRQYCINGDFITAEKLIDSQKPNDANDYDYYKSKAKIKLQLNKSAEASVLLNKAIQINPYHSESYYLKSKAMMQLNYKDSVYKYMNLAVKYDTSNVIYYIERAKVYESYGVPSLALEDINKALSIEKTNLGILSIRSNFKFRQRDTLGAIADCDSILKINPNDAIALADKGTYYRLLGKYKEALVFLDRSIEISPIYGSVFFMRAGVEAKLKNKSRACADLEQAVKLGDEEAKIHYFKCDDFFKSQNEKSGKVETQKESNKSTEI